MNFDTQNTARGGEEQLPPAKSADLDVGCRPDNVLGTEAQPAIRQLSAKQIGRRNLPVPPHAKRRRTYTTNQFHTLPELEWLVADLIPKAGVGIVYGASGSGKSTLCLDLARSVCTGESWAGHAVHQGNVTCPPPAVPG